MKIKKIKIEIFFPINKSITSRTLKEFLDAIELEGFTPDDGVSYGVFGKQIGLDYTLKEFDRVEVYHNASADPKKSRILRLKKSHKS